LILGNLLVRELWVGNLNDKITEDEIKEEFNKYGQIENIELYQRKPNNFAFIKMYRICKASRAFKSIRQISIALHSPQMKISFADHQRRFGIVGDHINHEVDDELLPILYVGYSITGRMPGVRYLRRKFGKYGKIKFVKCHRSARNTGLRSFAFVKFEKLVNKI